MYHGRQSRWNLVVHKKVLHRLFVLVPHVPYPPKGWMAIVWSCLLLLRLQVKPLCLGVVVWDVRHLKRCVGPFFKEPLSHPKHALRR